MTNPNKGLLVDGGLPCQGKLRLAPAIARIMRDGRWRRGELNNYMALKARKLLILGCNRTNKIRQFSQSRYNYRYNLYELPKVGEYLGREPFELRCLATTDRASY